MQSWIRIAVFFLLHAHRYLPALRLEAIHGNILATWQQELTWVQVLRQELN